MPDGNPQMQEPDISSFEDDLKQLKAPGPEAVSELPDRPLDNVSFHDFAFHEYLLPVEDDNPNAVLSLSGQGQQYLARLEQLGAEQIGLDMAAAFFTDIEAGIAQGLIAYRQQADAQQVAGELQQIVGTLYATSDQEHALILIDSAQVFLNFTPGELYKL